MYGEVGHQRAFTYKVTVPPAVLAVPLETFKKHIKATSLEDDELLTLYLEAAIKYCEQFTRRDLITRTYETFRDVFPCSGAGLISNQIGNIGFEIRRSPLQSIESIKYLKDAVLTTVAGTVYYNTLETDYSNVLTLEGQSWPSDADNRLQAIQITFKSGFGDSDEDIPDCYQSAIMAHAANMWANKGDCDVASSADIQSAVPPSARIIYLQNRIENL
jgi:uncharacterized phiE125 gp8 family phage protein